MNYNFFYVTLIALFFGFVSGAYSQDEGEEKLAQKYFEDGEIEQALELFYKLHKRESSRKEFVYRIASCYTILERPQEAVDFLTKRIKRTPQAYEYLIIKSRILDNIGEVKESQKLVQDLIYKRLKTLEEFGRIGEFFSEANQYQEAAWTYEESRKASKRKDVFQVELAELYFYLQEPGKATQELVDLYISRPSALKNVKLEIMKLVNPENASQIEEVLLAAVQKNQKDKGIRTIVYEFYVASEAFDQAFVQVKSIDKVFREEGGRVFDFGVTMRNNKQFGISDQAFDYVISDHKDTKRYLQSFKEKAVNGELQAFEVLPLDTSAIRNAVEAYDGLIENFGLKLEFFDAVYRKSKLYALYLNELEKPLNDLTQVLKLPLNPRQRYTAMLLTGDIYLMKKEFDKAKLQYQQVEKGNKDEQIGALAKFKLGKMDYYKGEFELSQARLSAIKENTSNDISNDAIRLNLLIQDNIGLDTTTTALQIFADAQLFIFQHEIDTALRLMDSLLYQFPNHSLTDEILWEKANIALERNELDDTFRYLDAILNNHTEDITADDAQFLKARIYDYNLKDSAKAMELYMDLLMKYPGSLYSVEVRKRIRVLRKG